MVLQKKEKFILTPVISFLAFVMLPLVLCTMRESAPDSLFALQNTYLLFTSAELLFGCLYFPVLIWRESKRNPATRLLTEQGMLLIGIISLPLLIFSATVSGIGISSVILSQLFLFSVLLLVGNISEIGGGALFARSYIAVVSFLVVGIPLFLFFLTQFGKEAVQTVAVFDIIEVDAAGSGTELAIAIMVVFSLAVFSFLFRLVVVLRRLLQTL